MLKQTIINEIINRARDVLDRNPALSPAERQNDAISIAHEIAPIIAHETNNEPWWQSRVTVGQIISLAAGAVGVFGLTIAPADIEAITLLVWLIGQTAGAALTLYGRWAAKAPLGS